MKLYTEEQVKAMIEKSQYTGLTADFLILAAPSVELPSDEEIWEAGNNEGLNSKQYSFVRGAKWMLYEIKGGKK